MIPKRARATKRPSLALGNRSRVVTHFEPRTFPLNERPLPVHAPGIARQEAVVAHDAMTWDAQGDIVRRTSAGDGAHRLGSADPARDLGIRHRFTSENFAQGLPDPLLECRAANIEWKFEAESRRFDKAN